VCVRCVFFVFSTSAREALLECHVLRCMVFALRDHVRCARAACGTLLYEILKNTQNFKVVSQDFTGQMRGVVCVRVCVRVCSNVEFPSLIHTTQTHKHQKRAVARSGISLTPDPSTEFVEWSLFVFVQKWQKGSVGFTLYCFALSHVPII